jgi:hypothetical protein
MRVLRRLPLLALTVLVAGFGLTACGGGGGDSQDDTARSQLATDEKSVDALVADLVPRLAKALKAESTGGRAFYRTCGMEPDLSGAEYTSNPQFGASPDPEEAVDRVVTLLEGDGWKVDRPANPEVVEGTIQGRSIRIQVGKHATDVDVAGGCVDSSNDLALEYRDRPAKDVPGAG